MKRWPLVLALICLAPAVRGAVRPSSGPGDPRIKWVRYDPEQVVELRGRLGYQLSIAFGDDERIENVAIGDGLGWQVTPNHRANLLFLKPMLAHATTNMTVVTTLRRYSFALNVLPRGARPRGATFDLRFDYPVPAVAVVQPAAHAPTAPQDVNHAYSYEGLSRSLPERVFDDGRFTYFGFGDAAELPAIFIADAARKESMAATSMRDGLVVVDQLAPRFVLRRGSEVTTILNDAYREPPPGPLSPRPRVRKKR